MSERQYGLETVSDDEETWMPLSCTTINGYELCLEVAADGTARYTLDDEPIGTIDLEGVDGDRD